MTAFIEKIWHHAMHRSVYRMRRYRFYPYLYPATLRAALRPSRHSGHPDAGEVSNFMTALPNPGAGIGHQIANWLAGYWFARQFGCRYAHASFPNRSWDELLGFGRGETSIEEAEAAGYRRIRLPLFDEDNAEEVARIRRIVTAHSGRHVIFVLERDQFYRAQHNVREDLAAKYAASPVRQARQLIYDPSAINVAVHVRRGDVSRAKSEEDVQMMMRWQDVDYFEQALDRVVALLPADADIRIHLFSQGVEADFASFSHHPNLRFCLDMNAQDSFMHLAAADVLIASKSGFSYCPALLGDGVRAVPTPFWHDYPQDPRWVMLDSGARFDAEKMRVALLSLRPREPATRDGVEAAR